MATDNINEEIIEETGETEQTKQTEPVVEDLRGGIETSQPAVVRQGDLGSTKSLENVELRSGGSSYQALTELDYTARTWVNDSPSGPFLNADNLNSMDGQIETLTDAANQLNTNIEEVAGDVATLGESVSQHASSFSKSGSVLWIRVEFDESNGNVGFTFRSTSGKQRMVLFKSNGTWEYYNQN